MLVAGGGRNSTVWTRRQVWHRTLKSAPFLPFFFLQNFVSCHLITGRTQGRIVEGSSSSCHPRLPLRPLVPSAEPGVFESSDDSAVQELMLVPCEGMAWRTNPKVSTAAMSFVYFLRRMVSNLVMNPKLLQTFTNNFSTWAWQHGHCPSCDGSGMLWRNSNLVPCWKLVRVLASSLDS